MGGWVGLGCVGLQPPLLPAPPTWLHEWPCCLPQRYARALVVLPYLSIINEKTEHLSALLAPLHLRVKGYTSGGDESGQPLAARGGESVAVCTIEKANVCVNRLAQEGRLGELVCEQGCLEGVQRIALSTAAAAPRLQGSCAVWSSTSCT